MELNANVPYVDLVYNGLIIYLFLFFPLCSCYCVLIANMFVFIIISSFVLFNLCFVF